MNSGSTYAARFQKQNIPSPRTVPLSHHRGPPLCLRHLETAACPSPFPCVWINIAQGSLIQNTKDQKCFQLWVLSDFRIHIYIYVSIYFLLSILKQKKESEIKGVPPNPHLSICEHSESFQRGCWELTCDLGARLSSTAFIMR